MSSENPGENPAELGGQGGIGQEDPTVDPATDPRPGLHGERDGALPVDEGARCGVQARQDARSGDAGRFEEPHVTVAHGLPLPGPTASARRRS